MCITDECLKHAVQVHGAIINKAHETAMNFYGGERVEMFLRNTPGGKFQVSTLAERLDVSGDDVYCVINSFKLQNDSMWRDKDDDSEVFYFYSQSDFAPPPDIIQDILEYELKSERRVSSQLSKRVEELKQIIAESDEDHSETLQELERAYNYIYSALQVIDGASVDSSTAVTVYTVRALLIAAARGQAVTS